MAINTTYYDQYGTRFRLTLDNNGFWVSSPDPDPSYFEAEFTAIESLNTSLRLGMDGNIGDWFQVDNVRLYGNDNVNDSYSMSIRAYDDAESSDDPQLYREISVFPNPLEEILVPVNEYITHTSFNAILGRMQGNFEFLLDKAKFLSVPPNAVSFRYGPNTHEYWNGAGNVWTQLDGNSQYWGYSPPINVEHVTATPEVMIYSTRNVLYAVDMLVGADPNPDGSSVPSRDFYIYGDDKFTNIKSIEVGANDYIWMLDDTGARGKVGIFSFNVNWKFESSWDVSVAGNQKYFVNPTDMKLRDGKVYISCDSDDGVEIRVFTDVGSYEGSVSHQDLLNIESIAVTSEHIIALYDNKLFRFDMNFNFIDIVDMFEQITKYNYIDTSYTFSSITKLINSTNGVFFYGIAENLIYKFGQSGAILESFGETAVNFMNSTIPPVDGVANDKPISDVYHDADYNLYVASEYDVIKYFDRAEVSNRLLDNGTFDINELVWSVDDINVGSDETAAAWIYNRTFDRILDNLNTYRLALKGSQALLTTASFEKVVIDNFKPSDYIPLKYGKGDIVIGVNELHCEGAINRCIRQLQECFDICLSLINLKDTGIDPDALVINSFTLASQTPLEPFAVNTGGAYLFDYGLSISNLVLKWVDSLTYRSDPRLEAFITPPNSSEFSLGRFPTPNTWTDVNSYSNGPKLWVLREVFDTLERTASITVNWSKRLYAGTIPDSVNLNISNGSELINDPNLQWSSINPSLNGILDIDVSNGDRYYIAVPKDEYDDNLIKLYQPDYSLMVYDWVPPSDIVISNFDGGYGDIGEYYVFAPDLDINGIYSAGIDNISFRLLRSDSEELTGNYTSLDDIPELNTIPDVLQIP